MFTLSDISHAAYKLPRKLNFSPGGYPNQQDLHVERGLSGSPFPPLHSPHNPGNLPFAVGPQKSCRVGVPQLAPPPEFKSAGEKWRAVMEEVEELEIMPVVDSLRKRDARFLGALAI